MKNLLCITLLLMLGGLAFAQQVVVPPCNANAIPPVTTNCTDYFASANWASSPLPAGTIISFTLIAGGTGYVNPQVTISDPTGTGASATATATAGVITGVTVGAGGSNYIIPQVTIVDVGAGGSLASPTCGGLGQPACGSGALATADLGGPFTGGMLKFQAADQLPDLKATIPTADQGTFLGSDFYVIGLKDNPIQMHSSLPPTMVRGYCQLANAAATTCMGTPSYLGPVILAQKNRPVRVLFKNLLPAAAAGGNLAVPVDRTYMGAGLNENTSTNYTDNRATLHLHGGATPWISDGTPHQWTTPASETAGPARGDSTAFVPDMWFDASGNLLTACAGQTTCATPGATNDPGPGNMTFYWTNQQGGRLMFYHDHAYGITRLNVYAGEAAGYLLYDPAEEAALLNGTAPGSIATNAAQPTPDLAHLIPLVIQDKTFVPSAVQLAAQDPTWTVGGFGTTPGTPVLGDLWFNHVYMTNQNPADPGGANGFGHWDYGPWFWPPQNTLTAGPLTVPCTSAAFPPPAGSSVWPTLQCPIMPNPSGTPEAFMDTPVLNGKAYPVLHVAPAAYRFKILAAGNDRSWNLSWFLADPTVPGNTEVAMLPAAPPVRGGLIPLCTAINPVAVPPLVLGLVTALLDANGNPLNGTGLPANCWPNYGPQQGIPKPQTMWAADGRAGGAPDPRTAGPPWIQIGTEGGLLPAPVVIPATPINYEQNVRSITIGSVAMHGLWIGPAERADVIVDFSAYAGKTLILYNDAPAPVPAADSRLDYFTGDGDQSPIGGAPNTQPGYGPNTRTLMQVIVDGTAPNSVPFSLASLRSAFASTATTTGVFAATQPPIIVPEAGYTSAYNTPYTNNYSAIQATSLTYPPLGLGVASVAVLAGGSGYTAPTVTFGAGCTVSPSATATLGAAGEILAVTLTNPGAGCATAPAVSFDPSGTGASATASLLATTAYRSKAIQELFTLDYGRMNATLGTELPLTNFLTQTTIPLGYIDPATEILQPNGVQLWKITHNGVDTHFIHFHLFNVQVINRMGWDGSLRYPDANELGWKETVRMNPLEDILVATQPIQPQLPWPIPDSFRMMDVTRLPGTTAQFTGIDPFTNNPAPVSNAVQNFGWEYVWHCHILGHEENDMMRPMVFQAPPPAPSNLTAAPDPVITGQVNLSWQDNSVNETSFTVQRATDINFTQNVVNIPVGPSTPVSAQGQGTTWGATITAIDNPAGASVFYRVQAVDDAYAAPFEQAYNSTPAVLSAWSNVAQVLNPNATLSPLTLTFAGQLVNTTSAAQTVTLSNAVGAGALGIVSIAVTGANATDFTQTNNCGTSVAAGASCTISVTFTPSATGARVATVTISSNNPTALSIGLSGNGIAPVAGVVPTSLTFAAQSVNTTSAAQTVTLSNTGTSALIINSLTFSGANTGDFAQTNNCPIGGAGLAIAGTCTINVTFTPAALGARSASLAIASSDPVNPTLFVPMTGTGIAPVAGVAPTALVFANQGVTTTSAAQTVTLSNTGTAVLLNIVIGATGDFAVQSTTCGTTLANGATCAINVTFTPTATGLRTGTLTVASSDPFNPSLTVALSGTGVVPIAGMTPASLTYGVQIVNTTSPAQVIQVSNSGGWPLLISSVAITGTNATDFAYTTTCPIGGTGLAAGTFCTVTVTFKPRASGTRTAAVVLTDNSNAVPGSTQSVSLTGTATAIQLAPVALSFANQLVGTTSTSSILYVLNVSTSPITINSVTLSGTNAGDFQMNNGCGTGTSLPGGRACQVRVSFRPTATGTRTALITVNTSDPVNPQTVPVTGVGVAPISTVSPLTLTFSTALNVTSASQPVTVTNTGTAAMTMTGISFGGSYPSQFAQTNNCPGSLAVNASCTINVTFTPTSGSPLSRTAWMRVGVASPATSQSVILTGNLVVPTYTVTPSSTNFGSVTVGQVSGAQTITVTNTGAAALGINQVTIGGANPGSFALITDTCSGTNLAVGAACTVSVAFQPQSTGAKSATLTVNVAAPATSQSAALSGTGI